MLLEVGWGLRGLDSAWAFMDGSVGFKISIIL